MPDFSGNGFHAYLLAIPLAMMHQDWKKYHPDHVLANRVVTLLPERFRIWLGITIVFLAWYGLISSVASVLYSFYWVRDFSIWLYENSPYFKVFLWGLAEAIHHIVNLWRNITQPFFTFLFSWVPFQVPRIAVDLFIIASIVIGSYIRAWFATSLDRKFIRLIRPQEGEYTLEGRLAIVRRLIAAQEVMGSDVSETAKDKAEYEFVLALEEMTSGVNQQDYDYIAEKFNRMTDYDLEDFLYRVALSEKTRNQKRKKIINRSIAIGSLLLLLVLLDILYVYIDM